MLRLAAVAALAGLTACQAGVAASPPHVGGEGGSGGVGGGPACIDADGDGYPSITCGGNDCDDTDPQVHPGAAETCGGPDRNCDGMIAPCGCTPGKTRPCYPPGLDAPTRNLGACHDGVEKCQADGQTWGSCEGAVMPTSEGDVCDGVDQDCNGVPDDGGALDKLNRCRLCGPQPEEICGNGLDDSCNGLIDDPQICNVSCKGVDPADMPCCGGDRPSCEHIDCQGRMNQPCYSGTPQTLGVGVCHGGRNNCLDDGSGTNTLAPTACEGEQLPGTEICGNGLDDDCDGLIDEDDGNGRACTHAGTCPDGSAPRAERCGDGIDSDCNGRGGPGEEEDAGCCVPAGEETCNGRDDDCDGLVDEGVSDACGHCDSSVPCFSVDERTPGDCADGTDRVCSSIGVDPANRDAFTLVADPALGKPVERAYFPVFDTNEVVQISTSDGKQAWKVDSLGDAPGPIMASPSGDGVWFLNQGTNDPSGASLVHLDAAGNVLCRTPLPGPAQGLAVDFERQQVWVGRFQPAELRAFAAYDTGDVGADGYPACKPVGSALPVRDTVTGIAMDDRGILWTASQTRRSLRLDIATGTTDLISHEASTYAVTIAEDGNAWFAGFPGHRIDADGPYLNPLAYERDLSIEAIRVAPAHDGRMWLAGNDTLYDADPTTMVLSGTAALPTNNGTPTGIAEDDEGNIWLALSGGRAARYTPKGSDTIFDVDPGHALSPSGDFTGAIARFEHGPRGSWRQVIDSGWETTIWQLLEWSPSPADSVQAEVFFASTRSGLDSAPACHLAGPPADLRACPGSRGARFMAIEIDLRVAFDGTRPSVSNVRASYTRP